jgi:hypothetical protein
MFHSVCVAKCYGFSTRVTVRVCHISILRVGTATKGVPVISIRKLWWTWTTICAHRNHKISLCISPKLQTFTGLNANWRLHTTVWRTASYWSVACWELSQLPTLLTPPPPKTNLYQETQRETQKKKEGDKARDVGSNTKFITWNKTTLWLEMVSHCTRSSFW